MNNFRRINTWVGWGIFVIALFTYLSTLAPSLSFWDCGEFISCSYKLQIGHPPGAPLYLMLGRLFSMFAPDVTQVATYVNSLSAVSSAFTILFLFWTITHLARKLVGHKKNETLPIEQTIVVIGAGVIGSLAFAFSDSFWFSAVEAEVYAMSSLFTAFVFWAILKWEEDADTPFANRWIVLISYAVGLSLGVHLLNLLAIPAIVLVVYFKKYKFSYKGFFIALLVSGLILGGVLKFVLSGLLTMSSWVELLFVNKFGWHYNSGLLFFIFILFVALGIGIYWTYIRKQALLNTIILSFTVMLIGFSSYAMIIIRAHALTPMNNNEATNVFSLLSYLNREQYGQTPLLKGKYFNAPISEEGNADPLEIGDGEYFLNGDKYEIAYYNFKYKYNNRYNTFFPRMYSSDPTHIYGYTKWSGVSHAQKEPPTFAQNLKYFFTYQLNHMYFRYFMWNFSGRQNNKQGHGSPSAGNWITGIPFIDSIWIGNQAKLPKFMKEDPSRNTYFMLPFILGIMGMVYQLFKNKSSAKYFIVTFFLFFLTGIAIVLYLNQTPYQPRERDYAYVGSFYTFAIWIGLGVLYVWEFIRKYLKGQNSALIASLLCLLAVPVVMAKENWDDHDRSGYYLAHDIGQNYLMSANEKNSILFCYGDNDSFPLWYNQDVEGYRTDIRVCNLSYLQSVWFISQMKRQTYDSSPMPISMTKNQYREGVRDQILFTETAQTKTFEDAGGFDLKSAVDIIKDDKYILKTRTGRKFGQFITNHFSLPVNKSNILNAKLLPEEYADQIQDKISWNLDKEESMLKGMLAVYDALANNDWKRNFYFAGTVGEENMQGLQDYTMYTGMNCKIVPINTKENIISNVDTQQMYDNIMNNFKWGNVAAKDVCLNETNLRTATSLLTTGIKLVDNLLLKNENKKAINVLNLLTEKLPYEKLRYLKSMGKGYQSAWIGIIERYDLAGDKDKASELLNKISADLLALNSYYGSMAPSDQMKYNMEIMQIDDTFKRLKSFIEKDSQEDTKGE